MFMGGGTTIVEGSRLGMQMYGADLNPVAWFIVRNALSDVTRTEVEALLADVEAEVRPQIMPFYTCDCPRGHHGVWTRRSTGEEMGADFDPLALTPEQRTDYDYRGPETVYVFWAKHGPCQVTGCGHRTPLIWNIQRDSLEPMFANANYHPKSTFVENGVFADLGRGNWASCVDQAIKACEWADAPWDTVPTERLRSLAPGLSGDLNGKSEKVYPADAVRDCGRMATLECGSATELSSIESESHDLIVTDPPFGGLLHYSELADFFHVWLRLALRDLYPDQWVPIRTAAATSSRRRTPTSPDA